MTEYGIHQLLLQSAQDALATMFFTLPDDVSVDTQRPHGELIAANVNFRGALPGRFGLVVSYPVARTLAMNFLGCDDDADLLLAKVESVIGELANIICGAVLSEIESDAHFDLDGPESVHVGADEPGPDFGAESSCVCRFKFSDGALVLLLEFAEAT